VRALPRSTQPRSLGDDWARIAAIGGILAVYFARMRFYQARDASATASAHEFAGNIALAIRPDLTYAVALTAGFGLAAWLARNRPGMRRALQRLWLVLAGLSVLLALINKIVVGRLGQPLSYQWLTLISSLALLVLCFSLAA
jgi:hypothetical protein